MNELTEKTNFLAEFNGKSAIDTFVSTMVARIKDGQEDALKYHIQAKGLMKALDAIEKEVKPQILKEADKYRGDGKVISVFGAKVEFKEVGVIYNYAGCADPEWERLDAEIKSLTERRKERETFLRSLKEPIELISTGTGEVRRVHPPVKKGQESIAVSF
jgi:hypothetical protein